MFMPDDGDNPTAQDQANADILNAVGLGEKQMVQMAVKSAMNNAATAQKNSVVVSQLLDQQREVQSRMLADTAAAGDPKTGKTLAQLQFESLQRQKAEQNTSNFAAHVGSNPDDSSYILSDLADQLRTASTESIAATQEVQNKMAIKFLDNPIAWLSAQITMGDSINAADQAELKRTKIQSTIRQVQEDTQQAAVTNNALIKTTNDATMQSELQAAQARVNMAVDNQKLQNIGTNIAGVMNLSTINAQQLSALHTAVGVIQQEQSFNIQKEHFDIQRQILGFQMQEAEARMEDRKATQADMKIMSDTIAAGLSAMGYKQEALQPSTKLLTLYKMGSPIYKDALQTGMNLSAAPKDAGGNPYPAISDNIGSLTMDVVEHRWPMQAGDQAIKKLMQSTYSNAQAPGAMPPTIDRKNRAQVAEYIGSQVTASAKNMMNNVERGGQDNIYAPPSIRGILGDGNSPVAKEITNSAWGKAVLGPMLAAGGDSEVNSQRIAAATAQAIKDGKITRTAEDMNGATLFYQLANLTNNVNKSYQGKGLPRQIGYNVQLDTGTFGGLTKYDLTQPKDWNAMLDMMSVQEARKTLTPSSIIMNR